MAKALGEFKNASLRSPGGCGCGGWGALAVWGQEGLSAWEGTVEDRAGLVVSPQVCVALQVPGHCTVAANRPEGGEGDFRDPHTRAL